MTKIIPRHMKLIVASDLNGGIGKNGTIPWTLKKDMSFFVKHTSHVDDLKKRNAVIMGRKCWESIPEKFRPLKNRLNVVVSRTLPERREENLIITNDFEKIVEELTIGSLAQTIESVWNIGGRDIYSLSLERDWVEYVYYTKVYDRFDADVSLELNFEDFAEEDDKASEMVNTRKKRGGISQNGVRHINGTAQPNDLGKNINKMNGSIHDGSDQDSVCSLPRSRAGSLIQKDMATSPVQDIDDSPVSPFNADEGVEVPSITPSCSAESQTETSNNSDGLLNFIELSPWDQVETMCEIVSCLGIYELRLLGACVEGAARPQALNLRSQEVRANSPSFISGLATQLRMTYPDTIDCAFSMVSLLQSTNRSGAYAFARLIEQLMADRESQLPCLPEDIQRRTLQSLGKLVTASLHHPAFSIDQKIRLMHFRDEIRNHLDRMNMNRSRSPKDPMPGGLLYIRRFNASLAPNSNHLFTIEMIWNDGERTYVSRNREEIITLHYRLLDLFGEERRDVSEFVDNRGNPRNSYNNKSYPQPTNVNGSSRILPHLHPEASPQHVIEYINGLSDLPARMMLSSIIYEEFYSSRHCSDDLQSSDCRGRRHSNSPPTVPHNIPATSAIICPMDTEPLSYGPLANRPFTIQLTTPSCSNCAGPHSFVHCNKKNILEINPGGKEPFRLHMGDMDRGELKMRPIHGLNIAPQVVIPDHVYFQRQVMFQPAMYPHPIPVVQAQQPKLQ